MTVNYNSFLNRFFAFFFVRCFASLFTYALQHNSDMVHDFMTVYVFVIVYTIYVTHQFMTL